MSLSKSTKESVLKYLQELENDLKCNKCGKFAVDPQAFFNCQHFFCKSCIDFRKTVCAVCGVFAFNKDVMPDNFIKNVTQYNLSLKALLSEDHYLKDIGNHNSYQAGKDSVKAKGTTSEDVLNHEKTEKTIGRNAASNSAKKEEKAKRKLSESKEFKSSPGSTEVSDVKNEKPNRFSGKRSKIGEMYTTPTKRGKIGYGEGSHDKNSTPPMKKSVNKRNIKGETPLHIACIKGNIEQVVSLIENGANPNVKDNFGWTPLYEAVNYKNVNIIKILLETAGAWVNTPGGENMTPLHNAAYCNWIEGVKILVECGANPRLTDIHGRKPIDISRSKEISEIMEKALTSNSKILNPIFSEVYQQEDHLVFLGDQLTNEDQKLLTRLLALIPGSKAVNRFTSEVTHIIVKADDGHCRPTINVLSGIVAGKVIASLDWIEFSLKMKNVVHNYKLGVRSTKDYPDSNGIIRSRLSSRILLPSLFSGLHFSFPPVFRNVSYKDLKKDQLISLIILGGGRYLSREPDPEAIPLAEKTVPFFANNSISDVIGKTDNETSPNSDYKVAMLNKQLGVNWKTVLYDLDENHPLKNCSHIILYPTENGVSQMEKSFIRYNMKHLKSLPIEWFIGCIESYTLLDPTPFI